MGLIYGNGLLLENQNRRINENEIVSIVYEEYCTYKSLLESCVDENEKSVLEAKVEVLREVSFKDIIEKIKELWRKFKDKVKELWNKVFNNEKIEGQRTKNLISKAKSKINKVKNESSLLEDASSFQLDIQSYEYNSTSGNMNLGGLRLDNSVIRYMNESINIIYDAMSYYVPGLGSHNHDDKTIKANLVDQNVKEKLSEVENSISDNLTKIKSGVPELKLKKSDSYSSNADFLKDIEKMISNIEKDIAYLEHYPKDEMRRFVNKCESNVNNFKAEDHDTIVFNYYSRANNIAIKLANEYLQIIDKFYVQLVSLHKKYNDKLERFIAYLDSQL